MGIEIERKFLVSGGVWRAAAVRSQYLRQGYLVGADSAALPRCSVRVRVAEDSAWLTLKSAARGIERQEYEYPIPVADGQRIIRALCDGVVEKRRWYVPFLQHTFEVDEFFGDNAGLVVAEIELSRADESFGRPAWLGREVSHEPRYYNVNLIRHPYSRWSAGDRSGA